MNLQNLAVFLKKIGKFNIAIGILLSILANAAVQFAIPGTPMIEQILGAIVGAIVMIWQMLQRPQEPGLVAAIHRQYTGAM